MLLKLPFQPDGGTRLKKWMFTFVLTDLTGRQALDGLIYSPSAPFLPLPLALRAADRPPRLSLCVKTKNAAHFSFPHFSTGRKKPPARAEQGAFSVKKMGLMVKCTPERGHNALFFIPLEVFIML